MDAFKNKPSISVSHLDDRGARNDQTNDDRSNEEGLEEDSSRFSVREGLESNNDADTVIQGPGSYKVVLSPSKNTNRSRKLLSNKSSLVEDNPACARSLRLNQDPFRNARGLKKSLSIFSPTSPNGNTQLGLKRARTKFGGS